MLKKKELNCSSCWAGAPLQTVNEEFDSLYYVHIQKGKRMRKWLLGLLLVCSFTVFGSTKQTDVVYGKDNRKDVYETNSSLYLELAKSTAGQIDLKALQPVADGKVNVSGATLVARGICPKERFSSQISAARCSGFLIGPDLVATAGHCIRSQQDCTENAWVFDYAVTSSVQRGVVVSASSIYKCKQIVKTVMNSSDMNDFAIVRLDRQVRDRDPLKLSTNKPKVGDPLVVIGHPTGLPTKISDGANVRELRETHFAANLDTYGGNSGSAVFNSQTGLVEGILVRGETDYVRDPSGCAVTNFCPDDGCRGEDVTYITNLSELLN